MINNNLLLGSLNLEETAPPLAPEQELFFDKPTDDHPRPSRDRLRRDRSPRSAVVHPAASDRLQRPHVGLRKIDPAALHPDTVDKREYGIGVVGEAMGRDYRTVVR